MSHHSGIATSMEKAQALLGRGSYTVGEFCQRNRLSKAKYYRLRKTGVGPREMWVEGSARISSKAEADWVKARELPADAEERLIERERRAERCREAARVGLESAKHPSKLKERPNRRGPNYRAKNAQAR